MSNLVLDVARLAIIDYQTCFGRIYFDIEETMSYAMVAFKWLKEAEDLYEQAGYYHLPVDTQKLRDLFREWLRVSNRVDEALTANHDPMPREFREACRTAVLYVQ